MGTSCFISTTAKTGVCRKCHAPVFTALDEGCRVVVDIHPLAVVGEELRCVLAGKRTFTRTLGQQLVERTSARIKAGSPAGAIHVEHWCAR